MTIGVGRNLQLRAASAGILALIILYAPATGTAASEPFDPEVELPANVVAGLNQADRQADEDASKLLDVQLALKLRNQTQLDELIRRVSTPGSKEHGHYLTPAQFRSQFGPTPADVDKAAAFLRARGLTVTAASPGSTLVDARGTVDAVQRALHTRIGRYREKSGQEFFANDAAPALPSSLASIMVGVVGLDNRHQRHRSAVQPRVCPPTCGSVPYTPSQIRTAYQLTTPLLATLTGSGQTLALFELDDYRQANIDAYNSQYSLPALAPQRQVVGIAPTMNLNGGELEVELDIELMHAIAPAAQILVFEGPNAPQSDVTTNDTYKCMVDPVATACPNHGSGLTASSNSTSWGVCEALQGPTETKALAAIFAQAAALGKSFFAASGDNGAHDCTTPTATMVDPALAVDSPASDPNVTAAGGTNLRLNTDNTINLEVAWSNHPNAWSGSGGGYSTIFDRPQWQNGAGVDTSPGAKRQVPDIALDADPNTGYSIYSCKTSACTGTGAGLVTVGGTSAAAPAWAAFAAVRNQYAACQDKPALGFANPTIYQLGSTAQAFQPFNDIVSGDNKGGTALGYTAGPNYDLVTGWGTLRASDFAQDSAGSATLPLLQSISPAGGGSGGGTVVTLTGCGFASSSVVRIDGVTAAGNLQFIDPSVLTATMPAHATGQVTVTVVNPGPISSNGKAYSYTEPAPLAGGTGPDSGLWVFTGSSGYSPKGGRLLGAPAIAGIPRANLASEPLYFGTGLDHNVWIRSDSQGWQQLAATGAYCIDNPAATVLGTPGSATLYVACQGGDHSLWYAQGPVTAGALPTLSGWSPLGGGLAAGPAVASVGGAVTFMVLGTDHQVWMRTLGSGYQPFGAHCNGHPALATASTGTSYFGCDGLDGALWYATKSGGVWSAPSSPGGHVVDGPGIGALSTGPSFFVEGTDGTIWEWSAAGGWVPHGGRVTFGTGASALS